MEKLADFVGILLEFSEQTSPKKQSVKTAHFVIIFKANFARNRSILR